MTQKRKQKSKTPDVSLPADKRRDHIKEDLMEHTGRWIAWTQDRQRILAVADSFAAVMK